MNVESLEIWPIPPGHHASFAIGGVLGGGIGYTCFSVFKDKFLTQYVCNVIIPTNGPCYRIINY